MSQNRGRPGLLAFWDPESSLRVELHAENWSGVLRDLDEQRTISFRGREGRRTWCRGQAFEIVSLLDVNDGAPQSYLTRFAVGVVSVMALRSLLSNERNVVLSATLVSR